VIGLHTFETQFSHGIGMGIPLAKQIGEAAKREGIRLSCHAPFFINLASKEKIKIEQSKKRILDSCERMHYMGGGPVVFHPSYFGGMDREKVYQTTKEAITDMIHAIKKNRWNATLSCETTGKHSALGSLDETMRMVRETGCSMTVDFAHLYARNNGRINYSEILDRINPILPKLGGHLHAHFSNIRYSEKGEISHLDMDKSPDFVPLAKEILKRKLDITIISETPSTYKDSLKMKKIFEGLGHDFS